MSLRHTLIGGTALALVAPIAQADVSAQDIWNDWKSYWSGFGYQVDATETTGSGTVTVTDLAMIFPLPEDEGQFELTMSQIEFVENGDGTVAVVFPSNIPMMMNMSPDGDVNIQATIDYSTDNFTMMAAGDPSEITYTYAADAMMLGVKDLVVDGEPIGDNILKIQATMKALNGTSIMTPGALRTIAQTMTLGETTYSANFAEPGGSDSFEMAGSIATMAFNGTTAIPAEMDPNDMGAAMADGFAVDGEFSYTGSSTEFSFSENGSVTGGRSGAEAANVGIVMNGDALQYKGGSTGVVFEMAGGDIPLPIMAQFGEIAFNMLIPVSKDETDPSDFAFALTLGDFVTSDMLWSMLDPGSVLPRDPATISLDLSGKAKMLFDLFDPEQMAQVEAGDAMPAELNALTLNNLLVSVAGAKLTGDGDFTFDNTDLESFDGLPKPTGAVNLELVGGNGLMDKLVQMGLLPEEQAMGARMMMGLFARPGAGDDTLNSTLEINEEGHILANGQRIQ